MRGRRFGYLLPALVMSWAAIPSRATAETHAVPAGAPLDYQAIRTHYDNGDFDRVALNLEAFIARHPAHSRDDSVFIAKHLAVVYSSNDATAEKGRQYMYRLVDLLPSSRLVDMYVQDERSRIFRQVREQFLARQHAMGVDTAAIVLPDSRMPVAPAVPSPLAAAPPPVPERTWGPGTEAPVPGAPEPGSAGAGHAPESRLAYQSAVPPASAAAFARTRPAPSDSRTPAPGFRTPKPPRTSLREKLAALEAQGGPAAPQADVVTPAQRRKAPRTSYLFAGGAAFVAAAAVTYFVLSDSPGTKERTYVVP